MNWGKGIAIALSAFICFIIYLAVGLMSHSVELESEDYYKREMAYEQEIQALNNAQKLDKQVILTSEDDFVVVQIPEGDYKDVRVELMRPNNTKQDKQYDILGTKTFTIPTSELEQGKYNVSISYMQDGNVCLQKDKIYVQ